MEPMFGKTELGYPGRALTSPDPWKPAPAAIIDIRRETHDTTTYTLAFKDPEVQHAYSFRPGQFNMLGFFGLGEAPISLSSDPGLARVFQHTIRAVGGVTSAMAKLEAGDVVGIRGPFGTGWPMEGAMGKDLVIVAGGIGLAPLRPAAEHAFRYRDRYGRITILYGAKTPDDLIYTADFDRWSAQPDTRLLLTVDRAGEKPWPHQVGVVPILFDAVTLSPKRSFALVCGPEVMMRFVIVELLKRGFPPEHVFLSMERRMRCGVAQCGHCFLGPKFVCQDGPVFRYPQLYGLFAKGV